METMRQETSKSLKIALWIALGVGLIIFMYSSVYPRLIVDAATIDSKTPVTVKYSDYEGSPVAGTSTGNYGTVSTVTFTTKSIGRVQWGEPDASGNYSVYFDAYDVHLLASKINEADALFKATNTTYLTTNSQTTNLDSSASNAQTKVNSINTKLETAKKAVK